MTGPHSDLRRAVRALAPLMRRPKPAELKKMARSRKRWLRDLTRAAPWFLGGNVVGLCVSRKSSGPGRDRGEPSLKFYVQRKLAPSRLVQDQTIPSRLKLESIGVTLPTDVEVCGGLPVAQSSPRIRPVTPGTSVGHPHGREGTLGLVVRKGDKTFYLSCAHVFAPGGSGAVVIGKDNVEQPADVFDQDPDNVIGTLAGVKDPDSSIDAAIAECNDVASRREVPLIGVPDSHLDLHASDFTDHTMTVIRNGVGSGLRQGNIDGFGAFNIFYPDLQRTVLVNDLVVYNAPNEGGDSGAAVFVSRSTTVAGLHIGAVSPSQSLFKPIQDVFDALKIDLA